MNICRILIVNKNHGMLCYVVSYSCKPAWLRLGNLMISKRSTKKTGKCILLKTICLAERDTELTATASNWRAVDI